MLKSFARYLLKKADIGICQVGNATFNALHGASKLPAALAQNLDKLILGASLVAAIAIPTWGSLRQKEIEAELFREARAAQVAKDLREAETQLTEQELAEEACRLEGRVVRYPRWNSKTGIPLPGGNRCYRKEDAPSGA